MRKIDLKLHEIRRLQILDAALKCFVKHGFHQASMKQICETAKMSPGNVYRYFKSKDDIILAASDYESEWVVKAMAKLKTSKNLDHAITKLLIKIIKSESAPETSKLLIEIFAESTRNSVLKEKFIENDLRDRTALVGLIRIAQTDGRASPTIDAGLVAEAFIALADGYTSRAMLDPTFKLRKAERTIRFIVSNLLNPLGSTSP